MKKSIYYYTGIKDGVTDYYYIVFCVNEYLQKRRENYEKIIGSSADRMHGA